MIKPHSTGFYAEQFNGFLDERRKQNIKESSATDWMKTYIMAPEDLRPEEEEKWPGCRCVCFRIPGYTIGHLIIDDNRIIKHITVYDRPVVHSFEPSIVDLEKELRDNFENKELQ